MNYEDLDLFLITSENWKKQKEVFYGYKTINNNGFWTHVFWDNNSLLIKGSFIQPCLYIYKKENFWAISNNLYYLEQHLLNKRYPLTKNPYFLNFDASRGRFTFSMECPPSDTAYNEIRINDNFSFIKVTSGKFDCVALENNCFTKHIKNNKQFLIDWYKKYYNYIHQLPINKVSIDLSGGFDSRILYKMYNDIDNLIINSSWAKDSEGNRHKNDGLLARRYLAKHHKLNYTVCDRSDELPSMTLKQNYRLFYNLFFYGIVPMDLEVNLEAIELKKSTLENYRLMGVEFELHKAAYANSLSRLLQRDRRDLATKLLARYYTTGQKTICPFLDKDFLELEGYYDRIIPYILLGLFDINDPEIQYWSCDEFFTVTEDDIKKAMERL